MLSLLSLPTVPCNEDAVADFLVKKIKGLGLTVQADWYGNLIVRRPAAKKTDQKIGFMAHMDHPGFEVVSVDGYGVRAKWLGGVHENYFADAKVRFYHADEEFPGTITNTKTNPETRRIDEVFVDCPRVPPVGALGMWDLPSPQLSNGILRATTIDDVAGCGLLLGALMELGDRPLDTEVWMLFTRAEEIGFVGALGLARSGVLPDSLPVISVEMSKAITGATQGMGPVIRLGDATTVFDNGLILLMKDRAAALRETDSSFMYQKAFMEGGSCEATVLNAYGYRSAGMAIPLGNYHNQTPAGPNEIWRVDLEEINFNDLKNGVDLVVSMCEDFISVNDVEKELLGRLETRVEDSVTVLEQRHQKRMNARKPLSDK